MRPACLLFCLTAAVWLGACGGGQKTSESAKRFSGDQRKVAQVVEDFQAAAHDGDNKRVCNEVISKRDHPENCESDVRTYFSRKQNRKVQLDVLTVSIKGSNASARVAIKNVGRPRTVTYPLIMESGKWKLTSVQS